MAEDVTTTDSPSFKEIDVLWKLVDGVGLEHTHFTFDPGGPVISGTVITTIEGAPVTIQFVVQCDRYWHTREVMVELLPGSSTEPRTLHLLSDGDGTWTQVVEGTEGVEHLALPQIAGCIDIDLSFSPATNTLPIRRYTLVPGAKVKVTAAWVKFPSLEISTLPQQYTRIDKTYVRYQSFLDGFTTDLEYDEHGVVRTYPGLWERLSETIT